MLLISFLLAVATFFVPKKYKQICAYISIGIAGTYILLGLSFFHVSRFISEIHYCLYPIYNFCRKTEPVSLIFRPICRAALKNSSIYFNNFIIYLFGYVTYFIYIAIAFAGMKFSVIKYKSDEDDADADIETTSDTVISSNDGKLLRVVEINAGLCTGTIRGAAIESRINRLAQHGWKFERFETIIGRCCLFFARYKVIICFSKDN